MECRNCNSLDIVIEETIGAASFKCKNCGEYQAIDVVVADIDRVVHGHFMDLIQDEWEANKDYHRLFKSNRPSGIRSSQLSALVAVLIRLGILK